MKRTSPLTIVTVLAAASLAAACGETPVAPDAGLEPVASFKPGGGRGGGPGGEEGPANTLTFRDDLTDGFKSDGSASTPMDLSTRWS